MNSKVIILTTQPQEQTVTRINTNKPEVRHANILSACPSDQTHCEVHFVNQVLTSDILKSLDVHNPLMIDYLQHCYESFKANPDRNYDFLENGVVPYTFNKSIVSDSTIAKLDYWKQAGIWGKDVMSPIFEQTWQTALESANNCYLAKDYVSKSGGEVVYCLNIYPGHHASYNTYGGYCFLNNGAICAKSLQSNGFRKIVILDLDHHAADGTAQIFISDNDVTTVSIHANPELDYPFYEGYIDENTKQNINFVFGNNEQNYLQLVTQAMNIINYQTYDVLIIAFGGDTYKNDPDASDFCKCGLDIEDYYKIGQFIKSQVTDRPIIVTQEGGYDVTNIHKIVWSFMEGLSQYNSSN